MECIFCNIISGKIKSFKIYEDESLILILDIFPANPGQLIIVPKHHKNSLKELDDSTIAKIFVLAKYSILALNKALGYSSFNILISEGKEAGQKLDHLFVLVIPRKEGDGVNIAWNRLQLDENILSKIFEKIRNAFSSIFDKEEAKQENSRKEHEKKSLSEDFLNWYFERKA